MNENSKIQKWNKKIDLHLEKEIQVEPLEEPQDLRFLVDHRWIPQKMLLLNHSSPFKICK